MLPALGAGAADVQLSERGVGEHLAVGPQGLLQDLLAVRDEQQRRLSAASTGTERGSRGPRRPSCRSRWPRRRGCGGGRARRARPRAGPASLLVGVGPHLEAGQRDGHAVDGLAAQRPRPGHRRAGHGPGPGRTSRRWSRSSTSRRSRRTCSSAPGWRRDESRTFHSTPSSSAARERLEEPTYAVSNSVWRRNSHALACSRVRRASYSTRTSAPKSRTKRSRAARSVAPT